MAGKQLVPDFDFEGDDVQPDALLAQPEAVPKPEVQAKRAESATKRDLKAEVARIRAEHEAQKASKPAKPLVADRFKPTQAQKAAQAAADKAQMATPEDEAEFKKGIEEGRYKITADYGEDDFEPDET